MSEFEALGLSQALCDKLKDGGITAPTPIQAKSIPLALDGHDIMGLAQTGTGKTMAFGLPMIELLLDKNGKPAPKSVKALILAPTRELVNQIADNLRPLTKTTPVRVFTVVGGQSINKQANVLSRGIDILVATPGRLIDLMERGDVDLSTVKFLVLDEADQMLDMGFIHALRRIAPELGTPRQTMLFSATMPKQMEQLSSSYLKNPKKVQVSPPGKTADKIKQSVQFLPKGEKPKRLRELLRENPDALTLVFARTKHGAERLKKSLVHDGFNAASIHGNKSQGQRDRAIAEFREGKVTVLVATDVAARGIDIPDVAFVINYDLPNVAESYVHRIGRTARAGREGEAISFCSSEETDLLRDIEKLVGLQFSGGLGKATKLKDHPGSDPSGGKPKPNNRRRPRGRGKGPNSSGGGNPSGGKPGGKPGGNANGRRKSGGRNRRPAA